MIIVNDGYPKMMQFEVTEELPPYKGDDSDPNDPGYCPVRTKIFQREVAKVNYRVAHAPTDFVVEKVYKTEDGEQWIVGS
jgi:hypothetical protein